jgi:alpha-glucosidase
MRPISEGDWATVDRSNHSSRYGRKAAKKWLANESYVPAGPADLALGTRRARAAALLTLALPGGAYIYQGEELGLPEVEDLPESVLQDPVWERSGHTERGRDGCRIPIPWSGSKAHYGFSPDDATASPWLPQPADWAPRTLEAQTDDETSMLELYRTALRIRREHPALGDGTLTWLDNASDGVLAFQRDPGFICVVNLSTEPYPLPDHTSVLLTSEPVEDNRLAPDQAAWLAL